VQGGKRRHRPENLPAGRELPPLKIQQAIVSHWKTAKDEAGKLLSDADEAEARVGISFLKELGLNQPAKKPLVKTFALRWSEVGRWGVDTLSNGDGLADLAKADHPLVHLGDVIADLTYGWSPQCESRPALNDEWGVLKLGSVSYTPPPQS